MSSVLYFAYGSNLDDTQMRARCAGSRIVGRAVLPDHSLVFGGFSRRWGGAVASMVRAEGARVEGLLYELGHLDLRALDGFEGHPVSYRRVVRVVIAQRGRPRRAATYLKPEEGLEPLAPPQGYLDVIWRAYERLGFDFEPLARAARLTGGTASPE